MEESFRDKKDRLIVLRSLDNAIQAIHEETIIASLCVLSTERAFEAGHGQVNFLLEDIWVRDDYCRAGVGMEMLATAKEWFYPLHVPESGSPGYLALLNTAKRKGLMLKTWPKEHDMVARLRKRRKYR